MFLITLISSSSGAMSPDSICSSCSSVASISNALKLSAVPGLNPFCSLFVSLSHSLSRYFRLLLLCYVLILHQSFPRCICSCNMLSYRPLFNLSYKHIWQVAASSPSLISGNSTIRAPLLSAAYVLG